jgi:hypothetical protein
VSAATAARQLMASKSPWWLLASFAVSTMLSLLWAAAWTLAVIYADYASHPLENLTLNLFVYEASLAMLGLQALALVGLYSRRHWGRAVATIGSGFWVLTVIGIPFTALVWWGLHRHWEPGVESTFTRDHPSAPRYVVGLTIIGATAILGWLWFLYIYLPDLLTRLSPTIDPGSWYWIGTFALFFSLPIWVVQGLAVVGLLQKHDWGAILAVLSCVLWIMSGIGLPFGIAGLFVLWRWQHPALRPGGPTGRAPAVPAGAPA